MEDLKLVFAKNLIELRKEYKLTQVELAEKINYSDKAVSKWERGESIPDVAVLKYIADMFGVTVDYLISEHPANEPKTEQTTLVKTIKKKNRIFISILPILAIFAISTVVYVALQSTPLKSWKNALYCYVFPLPVCAMLGFIFSAVWGKKPLTFIFVSLFIWLLILDVFLIVWLTVGYYGLIFVIGVPAQIIVIISFRIIKLKK